jgi:hypothetical protein
MKVQFRLLWSDLTKERLFKFEDWTLPIPRKGENVKLWTKYIGEDTGLNLHKNLAKKTLCHFHVEVVSYDPDNKLVEIQVSLTAPVLKN